MKRNVLIGAGAVVFLWTLLTQAPAPVLYGWAKPRLTSFQLYGVDGKLGDGSATALSLNGRQIDERIHWRLQPLWLLLGRVGLGIEGGGLMQIKGGVQEGIGGLRLRNLNGNGDAKAIAGLVGYGFAPINGSLQFNDFSLRLSKGALSSADGVVELHGLSWSLGPNPAPLGDFRATANTQGDNITIKVESLAGPLDTNGSIIFTPSTKKYDTDLNLHPKENADPMLRNMLAMAGPADPSGTFHLKRSAMLP
jgi:hypothetical protein